jgi:hypothetical protein
MHARGVMFSIHARFQLGLKMWISPERVASTSEENYVHLLHWDQKMPMTRLDLHT